MSTCQHEWEMTDIQFGFIIFKKCSYCDGLRTYFSPLVVVVHIRLWLLLKILLKARLN